MMNRQQQMIQTELEQMIIQNQQKDELLMMLMNFNKQGYFNDHPHLQNYQHMPQNGYYNIGLPGHHSHPHYGFNPQMSPHLAHAQQMLSSHHHPHLGVMGPSHSQASLQNVYGQNCSNSSRLSNMTNSSVHSYLNNATSETNLLIPEMYNNKVSDFSQSKCISQRDSETKKNMDHSDFSMQLEDSTTRISLNRNSFGLQSQPQQQGLNQGGSYDKTPGFFNQSGLPQIKQQQQYLFHKVEDDNDHTQRIEIKDSYNRNIKEQQMQAYPGRNQNQACGYKFISKGENSNSIISKIQKNPMISRLADSLTYIYTFEPSRLESDGVIEKLFLNNNSSGDENTNKICKSDNDSKLAPINTTIIQLNSKSCDDPLGNLTAGHLFEAGQKQQKSIQTQQMKMQTPISNSNNNAKSNETLNFSTDFLLKTFNISNQYTNKVYIKEENDQETETFDEIKEDDVLSENQKFIKKGHNSLIFNSRLVNTIESFLQKQLMFSNNPSKEGNDDYQNNEKQDQSKKMTSTIEKIKGMKGQLDFEDIISHINLETNLNEDALKKEIQQILHHFKSNHKVYFKKVRSQKEMLKDTKFHNLNKRIMRVLLSILNNPIILQLKVPKPIFNFFNTLSTKLVNSSKKLIKNTIVNDQYSHAHYNTMFLQISASNYQKLSQSQSDIDLHKIIYDIDLTLPYSHNYYEIQKTNILKQYIFLILDRTLRLNDTLKDAPIQAIRSMYIERVIKGMEKMNAGKIVQRF